MNKQLKKAILCMCAAALTVPGCHRLKSETAVPNSASSAEIKNECIFGTYHVTEIYDIPLIAEILQNTEKDSVMCDNNDTNSEDIELIALLTMAEAEGESEKGKRLVIDTVLNRVDSEYFPDTVHDVIYQPKQFSPIWNGRIERCYVSDEICELVREEMENRTDSDVIFFTAGGYSKYGKPLYKVGNHYFSSYE